jgi:REP element-mobilizing transposase RayT
MKTNIEAIHPNRYYHIYNRGVNRENLFKEERNYPYFLQKYEKFVSPVADTFAYCLMKNHFHILIRTKSEEDILNYYRNREGNNSLEGNYSLPDPSKILSNAFGSLFKSYAQSINKAYKRTGNLFELPFRRIEVTTDGYFSTLVNYIHKNPQIHGFVKDFRNYPHSSYSVLNSDKSTRLSRQEVLDWFGGTKGFRTFHEAEGGTDLPPEFLLD